MDTQDGGTVKTNTIAELQESATPAQYQKAHLNAGAEAFPVGAGNRVTWADRWLTRKMVDVVGNPPVRIYLWDNTEATPPVERPMAILHYYNRSALLKTISNPELHWGDLYTSGAVDFEGDLTEFMAAIYRGIAGKGKGSLLRRLVL